MKPETHSQAGQDLFVAYLFNEKRSGSFVDVGCQLPCTINNTYLLEDKYGWYGPSLDIEDLSAQWWASSRKQRFVCMDALKCDYANLFDQYNLTNTIDYLSLDIEGSGHRFQALQRVLDSGHKFSVITIEHDAYRGYADTERKPQRDLLTRMGYFLLCGDVCDVGGTPYEDWWIRQESFEYARVQPLICNNLPYTEILKRMGYAIS